MATTIRAVNNGSDQPVAYVGQGGVGAPTGWSAWAFAPGLPKQEFGWQVEMAKGKQALFTKAGEFTIWDDGQWNIKYQPIGGSEAVLVHVNAAAPIRIDLSVNTDGLISATQT